MAKKRRLEGASAALAALPTGAVLVGKLVVALGLPADAADGKLQGKTAHRYFSGERIEDEYCQRGNCETGRPRIPASPRPTLAVVEIGIILTNVGRDEEACAHLENLLAAATDASVHLLYNLGVVRMRCRMFETALDAFKLVLAKEEHHPRALDLAAHCAFVLGDRRAGSAYAKQANLVGEHETYNAWRMGMYEPRERGHR